MQSVADSSSGTNAGGRLRTVPTLDQLITLVQDIARQPTIWRPRVCDGSRPQSVTQLHRDESVDLWLVTWQPGTSPDPHDHGEAIEVFTVVEGALREERVERDGQLLVSTLTPAVVRPVAAHVRHDLRNSTEQPAVSIHAMMRPLAASRMTAA